MSRLGHAGSRMLAPIFVVGGLDSLLRPESKAPKAESVMGPVETAVGLHVDTATLVRFNGASQVLGGAALGLGVFRRLTAFGLLASLIPTTLAGHRYWLETDDKARAAQRIQLLKNLAMVGGLLLAIADGT